MENLKFAVVTDRATAPSMVHDWIIYTAKGITVYMKDVAYPSGLKDTDICLEVEVRAPYNIKTAKGIGVRSSTTELISAYGQPASISTICGETWCRTWYKYLPQGIYFEIQSSAVLAMVVCSPR